VEWLVLPGGSEHSSLGGRTGWIGRNVVPRVVSDDPSTVRELVVHAAGSSVEEHHHDNRD
jgi:hypothetical protein